MRTLNDALRTADAIRQLYPGAPMGQGMRDQLMLADEIERLRSVLDAAAHDIQCGNSVGLVRRLRESMVPNA